MSYQSRRELLAQVFSRYREAYRKKKTIILNEFIASSGYSRKYAVRLLGKPMAERLAPIKRQRLRSYGAEVQEALQILWAASNFISSKRLAPFLEELVPTMERHGHLVVSEAARSQLISISPATIDRILHPFRKSGSKGISTTKSGILLKKQILVRTFSEWSEGVPGFFEGDLVAHCGHSTDGAYLNTFVLTDIATGWVECVPLLFRSRHAVIECLDYVRKILPFPFLGLDTDNGSEFINADLLAYCEREKITFTRGRAYKKNDQCYVEQKNGVVVRQLVGYDRFEGEGAYLQLRELYRAVRLYVNFFQPSMKLNEKKRNGAKIQKSYYPAKTPFQRLRATLDIVGVENLQLFYQSLDPIELLRQIRIMQDALWKHAVLRRGEAPPDGNDTVRLPKIRFEQTEQNIANQDQQKMTSYTTPNDFDQQRRKYRRTKSIRVPHIWRTRKDPFEQVWSTICEKLEKDPVRTAKSLLVELQELYPEQYPAGQLRTLQRRIQKWRAKVILTFDNRWIEGGQLLQERLPGPFGVVFLENEAIGDDRNSFQNNLTTGWVFPENNTETTAENEV